MISLVTIEEALSRPLRVPFMHIVEGRNMPKLVEMAPRYMADLAAAEKAVSRPLVLQDPTPSSGEWSRFDDERSIIFHRTGMPGDYGQRITSLAVRPMGERQTILSIELQPDDPAASFEVVPGTEDARRMAARAMIKALRCLIDGGIASPPGKGDIFDLLEVPSDAACLAAGSLSDVLPVRYDSPTPWSLLSVRRHGGEELLTPAQRIAWSTEPLIECSLNDDSMHAAFSASSGVVFSEDQNAMEMLRIAKRLPPIGEDTSC